MDEAKVERYLGIIGKQTFVTYYELLADFDCPTTRLQTSLPVSWTAPLTMPCHGA